MLTWWTLIRWIHVVGAILWIGGISFVVLILRPVLKRLPDQTVARTVLGRVSARMRVMINIVIPVQIITGMIMAYTVLPSWAAFVTTRWGFILLWKIILATIMFALYYVVPRLLLAEGPAKRAPVGEPDCPAHPAGPPSRRQKLGSQLHVVLMVLGFVVILLAKMLV